MIDTTTWRVRTIDARASKAAFVADTLLVYGGESFGLTGYTTEGRERFRLFVLPAIARPWILLQLRPHSHTETRICRGRRHPRIFGRDSEATTEKIAGGNAIRYLK